jgi:hypothetical protein
VLLVESLESGFEPGAKRLSVRGTKARVDRLAAFYYIVPLMAGIADTHWANRQARLKGMSFVREAGETESRVRMRIDFEHDDFFDGDVVGGLAPA